MTPRNPADRPATEPRRFGELFGRIMQQHPEADARLVNDILLIVRDDQMEWAEAAQGAAPRAEGLDVKAMTEALHDWLREYNKDRQPYPGQCTGTHLMNMGDCQYAARAILACLSRPSDERVPESEERA